MRSGGGERRVREVRKMKGNAVRSCTWVSVLSLQLDGEAWLLFPTSWRAIYEDKVRTVRWRADSRGHTQDPHLYLLFLIQ